MIYASLAAIPLPPHPMLSNGRVASATMVTGASGYLGNLVVAALLVGEQRPLLLPIRETADAAACRARLRSSVIDLGVADWDADKLLHRVTIVALAPLDQFADIDSTLRAHAVDEIIHCAGCVDYYDRRGLQAANIDLTAALLAAAQRLGVQRFVYLSTAFCSGYREGPIQERFHDDPLPQNEPTEYTRSKRAAERLIAVSGIPYLVVRPSIVIGDSRTGTYTGKNYGLYQLWRAIEGLLCREYAPVWYTVAPPTPVHMLHQDAFQAGFLAIYQNVPTGAVVHLLGDVAKAPTMGELCWLWADIYCPDEIRAYACVDDMPLATIPLRQRRFLELTAKNIEIATTRWAFETGWLDALRSQGLGFVDTTLESVQRCQQQYIQGSERIQNHMRRYAAEHAGRTRFIEM